MSRELFERLRGEGEAGILRLIEERTQESVTLDFKLKSDAANGRFSKDDKTNLGKLMSAFANSAGGLAVWGIDARKGEDGVDCALGPAVPIADIERFKSEAQTLIGQLILPRHEGVEIAHISAETAGSGYLLVWVERSERRPHRCEAAGERQYFKRAGDSTFAMEHYDVEDAFRRIAAPEINIICKTTVRGPNREQSYLVYYADLDLYIKNTGSTIAKYPYLQVSNLANIKPLALELVAGARIGLEPIGQIDEWYCYTGNVDKVIHPQHSLPAARLRIEYRRNGMDQVSVGGTFGDELWVAFTARAGCENARPVEVTQQFNSINVSALLLQN